MEAMDELRRGVDEGRIGAERLLDLLAATLRRLDIANERIEELERQLGDKTPKLDEPFSMRAEEKRQEERRKKKKRVKKKKRKAGRVRTEDKIKQAKSGGNVFPEGVPESDCYRSHTRVVWRLENGRAVRVAYDVYRGPQGQYGQIPGVLGRSEFGLEFIVELVFLVHGVGLSLDKTCALLAFFQNLQLSKSQADALLRQLERHWEKEFETLCVLLANSAVVHADETSWSIKSVWAMLSEKARILLFGVPKDADTLKLLLDPETFAGLVISDDAAVYRNFTHAQKCWAHVLRKAIKLTLQDPKNTDYRVFTDQLLDIYREACRVQRDGRLSDAGRAEKANRLSDAIWDLCMDWCCQPLTRYQGLARDFRLLNHELIRLMSANELFTFVTAPPVEQVDGTTKPAAGTNNEAERTLRDTAQARDTGRTNKTESGAKRQTILKSVLESLRLYVPTFTLKAVLAEIQRWQATGVSCFEKLLKKLKLKLPDERVLDRVYPKLAPKPSG